MASALVLLAASLAWPGVVSPPASASSHRAFDHFDADATGRDMGNAYLLSMLSLYVYEGEVPGAVGAQFAPRVEEFLTPLGLSGFRYIDIGVTDTQAIVVETDDAVIVAFRGTQQPLDFVTDAVMEPTPDGIHGGFGTAGVFALPAVLDALDDAGDKKVWLTGHSLGGALAQVIAYHLAALNVTTPSTPDVWGVVTIGAPRVFETVGIARLAYALAYDSERSQRWVNNDDIVPHLVPLGPFIHMSPWTVIEVDEPDGPCAVVSQDVRAFGFSFDDHDVRRYLTRMFDLMPAAERSGLPLPPLPANPVADCDDLPNLAPSAPVDADSAANSVVEGAPSGTGVGISVAATDPNGDDLSYSLTSSAGGLFAIDPTTGVVTVGNQALLDFETAASHTITVRASDGALASTASFSISVINAPPTPPVDGDLAPNTVDEGAAAGSPVGVTATTADPGGGEVTFALSDSAGGRFAIDDVTGAVTVVDGAQLDGPATHQITVAASDGLLSSTSTFSISVTNVAPGVSITSLDGGLPGVGMTDVPVELVGAFADAAALDTHVVTVDWGDGTQSTLSPVVPGDVAASHMYPDAGAYAVTLTATDDDGGSTSTAATLTVHGPASATVAASDEIEALLGTASRSEARALRDALRWLEGNNGGAAANGALDKIEAGDLNAAVVMLDRALRILTDARSSRFDGVIALVELVRAGVLAELAAGG